MDKRKKGNKEELFGKYPKLLNRLSHKIKWFISKFLLLEKLALHVFLWLYLQKEINVLTQFGMFYFCPKIQFNPYLPKPEFKRIT